MKKKLWLLFAVMLLVCGPVQAQYLVPGGNPQSPAIRNAGGAQQALAIAQEKGWQPYQLEADTPMGMYGASGEFVRGVMPAGTWMGITLAGAEHVIGYVDYRGTWRGCGNLTDRRFITKVKERVVYRDRVVEVPVERTVYAFGPTVYPTAPMPQPQITYVARPPVYANWSQVEVNHRGNPGGGINMFANANGGKNFNANGNWNENANGNWNSATGGSNFNDIDNSATAGAENNNAVNTVVGTGSGNTGGASTATGQQGQSTNQ